MFYISITIQGCIYYKLFSPVMSPSKKGGGCGCGALENTSTEQKERAFSGAQGLSELFLYEYLCNLNFCHLKPGAMGQSKLLAFKRPDPHPFSDQTSFSNIFFPQF